MRAFGDRIALRTRFHDEQIHRRHQPSDPAASTLFDGLEQARLDASGTRWLPGIGRNLLAHPGADDDGLRWFAFEMFAGRPAPPEKVPMIAAVRGKLPPALLGQLERLAALVEDQAAFSPAAAAWVEQAHTFIPRSAASEGMRFTLPTRSADRYERRGRYIAPHTGRTDSPADDQQQGDAAGAGAGRAAPDEERASGYRIFTTAHDRVVNAAALASRVELEQLRLSLDAELGAVRSVISRLAKKLLRVLMARQVREWQFDLDEGLLDASRLAPMIASGGAARPFKQETDSPFPSTCVTLLIDHSGSMRGRPMQIAALTVEIFARVLERCGVKCEVLGFTTRDWDGGSPGREWASRGYPENPGRLNALEHIIIKSADVPWRRARTGLGLFMRDQMLKENIDGEAVQWAHRRLLARTEQRRILVVVSDGIPTDEATLAANGYDYLDRHLQQVVSDIESRSPVKLAAIGIGHDVSRFYGNATRIRGIEDLGPALTTKLITLLSA